MLGLTLNFFNPKGIPFLREKKELTWATDSLIILSAKDSSLESTNSSQQNKLRLNNSSDDPGSLSDIVNEEKSKRSIELNENKNEKQDPPIIKVEEFNEPRAVNLEQAYKLFSNGITFIDARDEADYQLNHIMKAINIPFDDFDNHKQKLEQLSKEKPLVIYCAGTDCDLSILLGNLLFETGYKQVYIFFGGWIEWQNAGYPTESSSVN